MKISLGYMASTMLAMLVFVSGCDQQAPSAPDTDVSTLGMGQHLQRHSTLTQINKLGYLKKVLNERNFKGKMMYGSDFPLINSSLVSAWYFPLNLKLSEIRRINRIKNPWDRDIALKQALGMPQEVYRKSNDFFGIDIK